MRLSLKPVVGALVLVGIYAAAGYIGVPAGVRWAVGNRSSRGAQRPHDHRRGDLVQSLELDTHARKSQH